MQNPNEDHVSVVTRQLKLEVEIAMQVGGAFEDCVTPAQAVELVKDNEPLMLSRRPNHLVRAVSYPIAA